MFDHDGAVFGPDRAFVGENHQQTAEETGGETIRNLDLEGQIANRVRPPWRNHHILSIVISTLFGKLENIYIILMLVSTIWLLHLGLLMIKLGV